MDKAFIDANWNNKLVSWFTVLGVSPAKMLLSNQWQKERNPGVRYIIQWNWADIYTA